MQIGPASRGSQQQTDWTERPPEEALQIAFFNIGRQIRVAFRTDPATVGVLHKLAHVGPMRVSALAAALALDISTTSRHVSGLEADRLLEREPDPDDRRATLLTLTPAGHDFLTSALEERAARYRAATESWSKDEVNTLIRLLNQLTEDLEEARRS